MNAAIRFTDVSKKFTLNNKQSQSFQELLINLFKRKTKSSSQDIWVLKKASFEINPGESVGFIGSNGAGKSTLLKLISQVIYPTAGQIEINGRVGALLELGSGFHPDLTGRENIYLYGAILGLSKVEIKAKFDDIVAFSELEQFINMPVKHYSSGMYVRLGFAVAVHIDPAILIVDEVLAVGDAAFQRKCTEHINLLRHQGVTILFVSHNLGLIQSMCNRVIWLDKGNIIADGNPESIGQKYMWQSFQDNPLDLGLVEVTAKNRWGSGEMTIKKVCFLDKNCEEQTSFAAGHPLTIQMHYQTKQRIKHPVFGLAIHRSDGTHITGPNSKLAGHKISWLEGEGKTEYTISALPLLEGTYYLTVVVCDWTTKQMFDYHDQLYAFHVYIDADHKAERYGLMMLNGHWKIEGDENKV